MALLQVEDLSVTFPTSDGRVRAVRSVTFAVEAGRTLGVVGESGSGKSVCMQTVIGLTQGAEVSGRAIFDGRDLLNLDGEDLRRVRGAEVSIVFQDPLSSLHPHYPVGWQVAEVIRAHEHITATMVRRRVLELLELVGIPHAQQRIDDYPHQFSGGMRQRVMLAIALALKPKLLIADEPTTALDVTIQAQILDEIRQLSAESDAGVIFVTHDLGVVADIADRVLVMYAGRLVEQGTVDEIFYDPQHPYTWGLLGSVPRVDRDPPRRLAAIPGQPPSLVRVPEGCPFQPRCPHAFDRCRELPPLAPQLPDAGHLDRCWLKPSDKRVLRETDGRIGLTEGAAS
jgi:oligopeptide/dipeptide ABC transporter ATP-binding protein